MLGDKQEQCDGGGEGYDRGGVGWGGQWAVGGGRWAVGGGRTENSLHLKYQPQQISSITLSTAQ